LTAFTYEWGEKLEVLLIHRPKGILPPELLKASIQVGKEVIIKGPLGGCKLLASYTARNQMLIVCIVDTPTMDDVIPVVEQMMMVGWDTEIIPVEKSITALPKMEKALEQMAKK
jgi:hypothetical protein